MVDELELEVEEFMNDLNAGECVVIVWQEGTPGQNFNGGSYDEKFVIEFLTHTEFGNVYIGEWFSSSDFHFCSACGCYNKHTHSAFDVLYTVDTIRSKIYKFLKQGCKVFVDNEY